jgi:uncharacterized protein YeeX (DUF496 family)
MILNFSKFYFESTENNYFEMYHGGRKWVEEPSVRKAKKGNYEGGNGIYFTNSYLTARNYSKGGGVVHKVKIKKDFTDIKDVNVELNDVVSFVKSIRNMKRKNEIVNDLIRYSNRINNNKIRLEVLNNLIVNHEAGSGEIGPIIAKYFVTKGVDATLDHKSGDEYWLVVFNPNIIIDKPSVCPPNIKLSDYMLPIKLN